MNVSREIGIYQKAGEKLIDSIEIDISIAVLRDILNVNEDDTNVYKIYELNKNQFLQFCALVPQLLKFDFNDVSIYYECFQV